MISEGIIHKFWKLKIAEHYKNQGFEVLVEENINGRPDIIVVNKDKRGAIEIETGKSHYIENIQRDIQAGFDEVICVATNKAVENKIKEELKKNTVVDKRVIVIFVLNYQI